MGLSSGSGKSGKRYGKVMFVKVESGVKVRKGRQVRIGGEGECR